MLGRCACVLACAHLRGAAPGEWRSIVRRCKRGAVMRSSALRSMRRAPPPPPPSATLRPSDDSRRGDGGTEAAGCGALRGRRCAAPLCNTAELDVQ